MLEDDPITLTDACEVVFANKITPLTLRAEAARGNLAIFKVGKRYFTTVRNVREMIAQCRVEQKVPGSISTGSGANGLSETERLSSARAAIRQTLQEQSAPSENISGLNSDPRLVLNHLWRKS